MASDPEKSKRYRLARKYGITLEDYNLIAESQGGVCAICGRPPASKALNLDHNHKTGDVRGLLCYSCNYGLPWFKDDPKRLRAAANYIETTRWEEINERRINRKRTRKKKPQAKTSSS